MSSPTTEPAVRPLHFLLAEDDDDHADLIMRALRENDVETTIDRVVDGHEAVSYLRREGEYQSVSRPDVVLLDINMPRVNGLTVLEVVKEDKNLRTIPIVVLTTSLANEDRDRAYEHHANSYLVKPVDFDGFTNMIQDLNFYWTVWNRAPR